MQNKVTLKNHMPRRVKVATAALPEPTQSDCDAGGPRNCGPVTGDANPGHASGPRLSVPHFPTPRLFSLQQRVPKVCAKYLPDWPKPMFLKFLFRMLALWPALFIQPLNAELGSPQVAMFSPAARQA